MREVTEQARETIHRANEAIIESLRHMSDVVFSELMQEDIETRLRLLAAELSTSTTLASSLSKAVEQTALKIQVDVGGGSRDAFEMTDAKGDNLLADLFGSSFKIPAWMRSAHLTSKQAAAELEAARQRRLGLMDRLAHYASAASIVAVATSAKRLEVVVCTEEVEAHRASCQEPVGAWAAMTTSTAGVPPSVKSKPISAKNAPSSIQIVAPSGIASKLKKVSELGNDVVGSALTSSADQLANTMVSFLKRTKGSAAATDVVAPEPPRARYVYSDAELAELELQREQLRLEERTSKSASAREVELSIQEVSSLTGLMREQVAMQDEQLQAIMGNTQQSHDNIARANLQLDKPLASFWNGTRMLIALMWGCTVALLVAHWIVR